MKTNSASQGARNRGPFPASRRYRTVPAIILGLLVCAGMASCGGGGESGTSALPPADQTPAPSPSPSPAPTPSPAPSPVSPPSSAMATIAVAVPAAFRAPPFDVPRSLTAPEGTNISVVARIPNARFMAVAPNGDLLVSDTANGRIMLIRPGSDQAQAFTFASGLTAPHDIVFHTVAGIIYLYIAQSNRIVRAVYNAGDTAVGQLQTVVDHLPDDSTPELQGYYLHKLKNIALRDNKLYVSIASRCNACAEDLAADPMRAAIHEYDLDGGNRRLYAQGLRNAEGLAFRPGTTELWVTVNGRDNVRYPFHNDWDGDGADDYGRVMQRYVNEHPPDLLTIVRDGGNYGWPFCNPNADNGADNLTFDRDIDTNADGARFDCAAADLPTQGLPAHSAPLGVSFLQGAGLPSVLENSIAVTMHGCWNCTELNGHKVALYPLKADGSLGVPLDLVSGWVTDAKARLRWGRPVDAIPDGRGGLYISDDFSGTVYRLAFSS